MNAMTLAPLSVATADTALAAYEIALTTRTPAAFETAAHALAAALRRDQALARSGSRPRPSLRLVADNPEPQSAPKRSKAQSASGPDLDAPVKAAPKKGAAVGAFHVVWADGTVTRVSAVTYHAGKPDTRWPLAYQLANRLRRRRMARDLRADLEQTSRLVGADRILSGGIVSESEAWRAYLASVPLAPLSAIFCENTGEAFDAPDGSAFGAGDRAEADRLAQTMTAPRVLGEPDALLSLEALRQQAHDARVLWETPKANPPAPIIGDPIGQSALETIDGRLVTYDGGDKASQIAEAQAAYDAAEAALRKAEEEIGERPDYSSDWTAYEIARAAWQERRDLAGWDDLSEAYASTSQRLRNLKADQFQSFAGIAWLATVDPTGRYVRLTAPGLGATLPASDVTALSFVAI